MFLAAAFECRRRVFPQGRAHGAACLPPGGKAQGRGAFPRRFWQRPLQCRSIARGAGLGGLHPIILFVFVHFSPFFSFCRTGGALYYRRRPCFAIHKFCFKLMKQNFVIFRKTPTKTRNRQIARFLFGVFLAAAYFRAHLYQNAAASPFLREPQVCGKWGALTERRGFRTRSNDLCSSHDLF